MKSLRQGDRVVCTCGFAHKGTVVAVLRMDVLVGVAWDDAAAVGRHVAAMETSFRDNHARTGHMISVLTDKIELDETS